MTLIRTSPSGPNVEVDAPVDLGPNTVYGNPTAAPAPGVDIPLGLNTVLGRVAGNIVAAQLVTAQIALNQVTNALLAQGAALTVKANPTGALADFQDVPALADDTVFRRVGGALGFGQLTPGMLPPAIIPLSSIEPLAANTVVANATAGAASPTAVPIGTNTVLGRVAGNIVAAQVVGSQIGTAEVQNANLGLMDAQTVKVNATGAPASPTDLVVGMNSVLGRVGGNIIAAQLVTAQIALNQVDNTILAKMAANTVKVNATALLADPQDLAVGANTVLGRVAGNIVAAQLVTAQIALNQVTNETLAQMAALTVKANATAALADPQDVAASSNDTLLRRTSNTLNFGPLTAGMIPSAIIPLSAIEQLAANTVVANATAGVASPTAVVVGFNTVLGRVAGNIVAAQLVTAQIALNQVTNAVLAQMAANTLKGNATAALADPQDISVGTNTVVGRVAGNIVAAQLVTAQIADSNVTLAKIQNIDSLSILARIVNTNGPPQELSSPGPFAVPYDNGAGALVFDLLVTGNYGNGTVTLPKLATQAANTVVANATAGTASPTAVAVGTNTVLGRVAGNIVAAQLVTAQIAVNQVTNAVLAQMAANTLKGNATAALADPQDISVGTNTVVGRVAGNIVAAQLVDAQITTATISLPKLATQAADTLVANVTSGAASPTAVLFSTLVSATTSLAYDATNHRFAYIGSTSSIASAPSGAVGVLNIATLECGGQVLLSPAASANIDGFTAKAAGFWFDLIYTTTTGFTVTLNNAVGTTTSIQCAGNVSTSFGARAMLRLRYNGSNWVVGAADSWSASLAVNAHSGAFSPIIDAGQALIFGAAGSGGDISASGSLDIVAAGNVTVTSQVGSMELNSDSSMTVNALTGDLNLSTGSQLFASAQTAVLTAGSGSIDLIPSTFVSISNFLRFTEQAASTPVLSAGQGLVWVRSDTPNVLMYTDDTNADFRVALVPVPNADLAAMAANTVKANATASSATPTDVAVGTNTVLGRVAGNIVAAQLVTAQVASNQITNALLAQMAALTVKANATNATANAADLAAGSDDTVLRRTGSTLNFGQLTAGMFPAAVVPLSSLATQAANTVVANATAGVASPTAVAVGTNTVLGRVAGNIVAAQIVTAQIAVNQVTNAVLAQMAANTVKANATAALADPQDLAVGTNTVVGRVAGNIVAAQVVNAQITGGAIGTVKGVAITGVAGTLADLTGLNVGGLIRYANEQADTTSSGTLTTFSLTNQAINVLTFNGNTVTLHSIVAPTTAGTFLVLKHIGAGTLTLVQDSTSAPAAVDRFNFGGFGQNTTPIVLGAGQGGQESILLIYFGSRWQWIENAFAAGSIPTSALAAIAANTVIANATAGSAVPTAVAVGTNTVLGRVAGNIVAAQLVNAQFLGGGPATLKGVPIGGVSGTLADITQTQLSDLFRVVTQLQETVAPGTVNDYAVAETTKLWRIALNADGDYNITGIALGSSNTGGWIRLFNQSTSLVRRIVLRHSTGSAAGNQFILPGNTDFILDHFGDAVDLQYIGGRWQVVAKLLSTTQIPDATVTLPKLATQAANTVVANATAGTASPTAVSIGTNTVLGRVAGNIVAAQVVNAQITGGAIGTVKGVGIAGVAGTLQDLTGAQQAQIFRRDTIQTILDADIVPGTPFDVTLNNDTTVLLIRTNNAQQLRTMLDNSGIAGREVHIEYDPTSGIGTLELMQNTAGGIGGSSFFNTNAQRLFMNRTSVVPVRLRSGFWRPVGPVITPWNLASENTPIGVVNFVRVAADFTILLSHSPGAGGAPDDVEIFNANAPYAMVIKDVFFICTTGVVGGTVQLRSATGGGGSALSSVLSAAAAGTARNALTANMPTVAAGGSIYMRRSDSGIGGQMVMTCYKF